jgi:hypothetical protein
VIGHGRPRKMERNASTATARPDDPVLPPAICFAACPPRRYSETAAAAYTHGHPLPRAAGGSATCVQAVYAAFLLRCGAAKGVPIRLRAPRRHRFFDALFESLDRPVLHLLPDSLQRRHGGDPAECMLPLLAEAAQDLRLQRPP